MRTVAILHSNLRSVSDVSPHRRSFAGLFGLFGFRVACILLLGLVLASTQLVIIGIASANPIATFFITLTSCIVIVGVALAAFKAWLSNRLSNISPEHRANALADELQSHSAMEATKQTTERLALIEKSLKTFTKSLDELEGRTAFLQSYVEELHEEHILGTVDLHLDVDKMISEIQKRIELLSERVEHLLEESVDQTARRPNQPR